MFPTKYFIFVLLLVEAHGSAFLPLATDVTTWNLADLDNGTCKTDLTEYIAAVVNLGTNFNLWAFQMFDSSVKIPNGILEFNLYHIGMFDECLAVRHPDDHFTGQHCMISLSLFPPEGTASNLQPIQSLMNVLKHVPENKLHNRELSTTELNIGVCLPSSCTAADLNQIFGEGGLWSAKEKNCWKNEDVPIPMTDSAIAFLCVCALLAVITAASTCYHYLCDYQNRKPKRLASAFSLKLHLPKLFEIRALDGDTMGCLHGIRTLSMMWVVLCHTYMQHLYNPLINLKKFTELKTAPKYILVSNGFYSVETFFFLSGLLVTFVFFRNIGRSGTYDFPMSYVHRFLRLTPPFALMVFAQAALVPVMGYGPQWFVTIPDQTDICQDNWWSALLYVHNYVNPATQCLGQTWYLAVDMQMFWIAPLLLYPILWSPKYGATLLGAFTMASTVWTCVIAFQKDYKANLLLYTDQNQFNYEYVATHMRMTPYLVGMVCALGICTIKARKIKVRLSKVVVVLGWCISTAVCLGILFSIDRFNNDPETPSVESALYLSYARLGWGVGLAWIVFACIYGYGGLINTLLSLGVWQPLAKLSYAAYLIHPTILTYKSATMQTSIYLSDLNTVYDYLATLVLAYLLAILLYSMAEAPFVVLDQELLGSVHILQYPKPKPKSKQLETGAAPNEVPKSD